MFSQFFPIVGISQSLLFHNNEILLSQIYPCDGILLSLNYPNTGILLPQIIPNSRDSLSLFFSQYWDFQTLNISNSGMSLSPNFPKTGILLSQNSPNSGIFMGSYFLSLYVPNFRDFIVSDLLQRWDLAGFKLTITQIFPSGTTGRNDVKCM